MMPDTTAPQATPPAPSTDGTDNLSVSDLARTLTARRVNRRAPAAPAQEPPSPSRTAAAPPPAPAEPTELPPEQVSPPQPPPAPVAGAPAEPPPDPAPPEPPAEEPPDDPPPPEELPDTAPLHPDLQAFLEDAQTGKPVRDLAKRLHKTLDRADRERHGRLAAEQRIEQLETELHQARETPPPPPANGHPARPADAHPEVARLNQQISQIDQILQWSRAHRDGGTLGQGDGAVDYDADGVDQLAQDARDARADLVAQRSGLRYQLETQHNQQAARWESVAVREFPFLAEKQSAGFQLARQIAQAAPELRRDPRWPMFIGHAVAGHLAWQAKQKANGAGNAPPLLPTRKPAPAREPTPQAGRATAAARPPSPRDVQQQQQEAAENEGKLSTEALAQQFSGKRRAQRAAA